MKSCKNIDWVFYACIYMYVCVKIIGFVHDASNGNDINPKKTFKKSRKSPHGKWKLHHVHYG